jgi:hypothetical protein
MNFRQPNDRRDFGIDKQWVGPNEDSNANGRGYLHGTRFLCSATIAARTASIGELIRAVCSTAKNRRLSLPSIDDDQA